MEKREPSVKGFLEFHLASLYYFLVFVLFCFGQASKVIITYYCIISRSLIVLLIFPRKPICLLLPSFLPSFLLPSFLPPFLP